MSNRHWKLSDLKGRVYEERLYFQCPACKPSHTCAIYFGPNSGLKRTGLSIEDISLRPISKNVSPQCKLAVEITNGVVYERT